jgi:hypothetical protein
MNAGMRVVAGLVVALVLLFGARTKSKYELIDRATEFRAALRERGLATERGLESVPSESVMRDRTTALADEYGFDTTNLAVRIERNAAPVGVGRLAADRMGDVQGARDIDAEGNLVAARTPTRLRTTRVEIRVGIHAEGFLVAHDEEVLVERNIGFAMR